MKYYLFLLSILLCMMITSCTDTAEDLLKLSASGEYRSTEDDNSCPGIRNHLTRSMYSTNEDVEDVTTTGYTSVENGSTMKLLFSSQLANLTGLQAGSVYLTRYETYHKKISLNGASFFDDESCKECGLRRHQDINGGYLSYTERGYNAKAVGTNQIDMETHLIHVISDMSGNNGSVKFEVEQSVLSR